MSKNDYKIDVGVQIIDTKESIQKQLNHAAKNLKVEAKIDLDLSGYNKKIKKASEDLKELKKLSGLINTAGRQPSVNKAGSFDISKLLGDKNVGGTKMFVLKI